MAAERDLKPRESYLNPVHPRDFPDPYVFKFAGEYYAYCTGLWSDGRRFGVMRSRDLVRWEELAGALRPLPGDHPCYWAPEVVYRDGRFLMYYSVGNEKLMEIRVAVADRPEGPFEDSGHRLTTEEFAIDAHVFADRDGARYLFYATDFLEHTHVGTGTVVDRMLDDYTLEGRPRPVTRARYDWQVYDPERKEKGGVRWHTVEGPFVLERKGRYYEMFSGGNWQNLTYGVSYATSERILRDDEWEQHADGTRVLPILRTIPDKAVGPGHNSVVRGPDNRQLYCVYHRWDGERGRVLAIDRQEFVGERMSILGPTTAPQPAPLAPWFADYFDEPSEEGLGSGWTVKGGDWSVVQGAARQAAATGTAEALCAFAGLSFLVEVSLWALGGGDDGAFGVLLYHGEMPALRFMIEPGRHRASLRQYQAGEWFGGRDFDLPVGFTLRAFHHLRLEVDAGYLKLGFDDGPIYWAGALDLETGEDSLFRLSLLTDGAAADFKGFALTHGWQDDFDEPESGLGARGWVVTHSVGGACELRVTDGNLRLASGESASREWPGGDEPYELVFNVRIDSERGGAGARPYSLRIGAKLSTGEPVGLQLERGGGDGWSLTLRPGGADKGEGGRALPLPAGFDPFEFQQFRFRLEGGRLAVQLEAVPLGEIEDVSGGGAIGIAAGGASVAVDMVRLTAIKTS